MVLRGDLAKVSVRVCQFWFPQSACGRRGRRDGRENLRRLGPLLRGDGTDRPVGQTDLPRRGFVPIPGLIIGFFSVFGWIFCADSLSFVDVT
ncbi:MAG: hypothetical protein AMJ65_11715 [Phycisphaerae bacterium SG8_4]|nr:MAG: hypothetical protein AMJ65_11715 [Phycisphaerae bacterium SG8_4]